MDQSSTTHGESPPRTRHTEAGDAEVVSMKVQLKGCMRLFSWAGAALLLAFLVGAPREAGARYYQPSDPPLPDGDPTADDQPSPGPKQSRNQTAVLSRTGEHHVVGKRIGSYGRMIWLSYVRVWIRIAVR